MQDAILNNAPSTSFGSLTAILVPYVGRPIYEVTLMVASSGEIEGQQQRLQEVNGYDHPCLTCPCDHEVETLINPRDKVGSGALPPC